MPNSYRNGNSFTKPAPSNTANAAVRQAALARLAEEYHMEGFLNPLPQAIASEVTDPFAAFPSPSTPTSAEKPPVVVVIKRRRVCATAE